MNNKESDLENLVHDATKDDNTEVYDQTNYMTLITINISRQILWL